MEATLSAPRAISSTSMSFATDVVRYETEKHLTLVNKVITSEELNESFAPTSLWTLNTTGLIIGDVVKNGSLSAPEEDVYYFYRTEQLTFLWILFILILFGNCSVLVTLLMSKNRKTRMNFFIMHLAIADLLVGLVNVLTDIIWRTTIGFYAGNIACKVVRFSQVLVTYSSTYVLVSLSIDRYDAITHPLNFTGSWKRAKLLVGGAWCFSLLFSVPAIFLNEEAMVKGHPQCWIDLEQWQWQIYITLVALSLFFIPAIIISSCYFIIVHTIWNKSKSSAFAVDASKSLHKQDSTDLNTAVSGKVNPDSECERSSSRGVIPRAKIKTVKMTLVIVLVFILCWSPYFVWDLLQVYGFIPDTHTTIALSTFIQSMAPLNSAANPFIYCLFSARVIRTTRRRTTLGWILEKMCCCFPCLKRFYNNDGFNQAYSTTYTSTFSARDKSTKAAADKLSGKRMTFGEDARLRVNGLSGRERMTTITTAELTENTAV